LQTLIPHRIKALDNRLANQIAAGEVVERPSSVVKELLENSIDAKANRIEVDIERGGTRLIRIIDNGFGIDKDDLTLALSRHATSKISTISDLAAIHSLGFRGEALASIASVSRLSLTSRTKHSDHAWQAIAEGREMNVDVQPASAIVGTRIEVRDLFYNTPARQKFLRAEKTEFSHIEEVFKYHALANFHTAFILKHNNKVVKRVPASKKNGDYLARIASICGKGFADNAVAFCCQHDVVSLNGWLGKPSYHRSESDIQYVFVNGRPVKDKMLNHAIRQSYQGLLPPGRMPTFVIFLQIDAEKIDVNVHPTKHEVRFDDQRMVHDLLVKSISEHLAEVTLSCDSLLNPTDQIEQVSFNQEATNNHNQIEPLSFHQSQTVSEKAVKYHYQHQPADDIQSTQFSSFEATKNNSVQVVNLLRLNALYWNVFYQNKSYLINEKEFFIEYLDSVITKNTLNKSRSLLFPKSIKIDHSFLENFEVVKFFQSLGFIFDADDSDSILLKQAPLWLIDIKLESLTALFFQWIESFSKSKLAPSYRAQNIFEEIYKSLKPFSYDMIQYLLEHQALPAKNSSAAKQITSDVIDELFENSPHDLSFKSL